MKTVAVEHAVGMVLAHDITRIVPGRFKGPAYRRGQIITDDDVEPLKDLGKQHIAVLDLSPGTLHEDAAARRVATAAAGEGICLSDPSEGKVNLIAADDGLLKINVTGLDVLNERPQLMMATSHTNRLVTRETIVAGTRIIPLTIEESVISAAEKLCSVNFPIVSVKPLMAKHIGIITTGTEIYHGRIEDSFGPVLKRKIEGLGSHFHDQLFVPDDVDMTVTAIRQLIAGGAQLVLLTGGMSVDPDDLTPTSIRATGAEVVCYGAPVLPGAMFMLAYLDKIPLIGLPGCVMYHQTSIFDLILPRILAGEILRRHDITQLGHGGMCSNCSQCRYPDCPFGA